MYQESVLYSLHAPRVESIIVKARRALSRSQYCLLFATRELHLWEMKEDQEEIQGTCKLFVQDHCDRVWSTTLRLANVNHFVTQTMKDDQVAVSGRFREHYDLKFGKCGKLFHCGILKEKHGIKKCIMQNFGKAA